MLTCCADGVEWKNERLCQTVYAFHAIADRIFTHSCTFCVYTDVALMKEKRQNCNLVMFYLKGGLRLTIHIVTSSFLTVKKIGQHTKDLYAENKTNS